MMQQEERPIPKGVEQISGNQLPGIIRDQPAIGHLTDSSPTAKIICLLRHQSRSRVVSFAKMVYGYFDSHHVWDYFFEITKWHGILDARTRSQTT